MFLSLDRWMLLKYPSPNGQYKHRRCLVTFLAVLCWVISVLLNIPIVLTRYYDAETEQCDEYWMTSDWEIGYVIFQMVLGYVLPCVTVMGCHLGLRAKVAQVSLSAKVLHGELPLPFPFMRETGDTPILLLGLKTSKQNDVSV